MNDDLYSGYLRYKEIDFAFVFDGEELQLTPPKGLESKIFHEWVMTPIGDGVYSYRGDKPQMEESHLVGECTASGKEIVFLSQVGARIGFRNTVFVVPIYAYIVCKRERKGIDRISFRGPEIDYIHPVNQAVQYRFDQDAYVKDGVFSITTLDFDATTTQEQEFAVDGKRTNVRFSITRGMNMSIGNPPITLYSTMLFDFEETDDYEYIIKLWGIAKEFIRFLCYRRNVFFSTVELSAPDGKGMHIPFATLHVLHEAGDTELETLHKKRYIQQSYINGYEGKILEDIAENTLYTRHIPETYASGKHINAARFVMIIAAFEWEFRRVYPDGIPRDEKKKQIEEKATEEIENRIKNSTGELKKKYKFLKRLIKSDPLQIEISQIGKDYDEIVGIFGEALYHMNGEQLIYSEMGQRLGDQRNHYAHGDLDKEFIGASLLDLMYMELILYAMQLKRYGVSNSNIQKAINQLFERHVAIGAN